MVYVSDSPLSWRDCVPAFSSIFVSTGPNCELLFAPYAMSYPSLGKIAKVVSSVVPYFCAMSLNSPLSWPPSSLVFLLSADVLCHAIVDAALLTACSPAVVPGAGRVARSALSAVLPEQRLHLA